ncbi:MAG: hypothetical protein GWO28_16990, partial [candidate division Zixibacteria bacterium]|nr:hypothetical protein [candidate division Zixibacteria bacterium]
VDVTWLLQDWYGESNVIIRAVDAWGMAGLSPIIRVVVNDVNDPPRLGPIENETIREHESLDVMIPMHDPDKNDSHIWSSDNEIVSISEDSGRATIRGVMNPSGLITFNITVKDSSGESDVRTYYVRVINVNDDPRFGDPDPPNAVQDERFYWTIPADDPDIPYGDHLEWYPDPDNPLPVGSYIDKDSGLFSWTPTNDAVGRHTFGIVLTDANGSCVKKLFSILVLNVNDPVVIQPLPNQELEVGRPYFLRILVVDPDLEIDANESLTFSISSELIPINSTTGIINFTPGVELYGIHYIEIFVSDSQGTTDSTLVTFNVSATDFKPFFIDITNVEVYTCIPYETRIVAIDPDRG